MSANGTDLKAHIAAVADGRPLSASEAEATFDIIMSGEATPSQIGGLLMALTEIGQSRLYFMNHVLRALTVSDIVSGVGKTVFFAFQIGVIACYNGIHASGGADGVGKATTNTVVVSSIAVIVSDFFLTKLFLMVF